MAQLCFLIVASFILWGKVYSPQFVMWLIPLVVLATPRWRAFWIWQAVEVYHWGGVWMESARITSDGAFAGGAWYHPTSTFEPRPHGFIRASAMSADGRGWFAAGTAHQPTSQLTTRVLCTDRLGQ